MGVPLSNINAALAYFELPSDATMNQVRERYYELVKVWHPDRQPSDPVRRSAAEKKIRELNRIYNEIELSFGPQTTAGESEQEFDPSIAAPGSGPWLTSALELFAAPVRLLFGLIKSAAVFPLILAAEVPGIFLYAGVLLMSAAAALVLLAGINYVRGSSHPRYLAPDEEISARQQLAGSLDEWAAKKKTAAVDPVRTIAPEKSAVSTAPEIIKRVLECDLDGVNRLLETDRSTVNLEDENGDTALAWAAKRGCSELIDPLLRAGARRDSRAENGLRPADWAKRYGFKEIAAKLERLH